MKKEGKRKFKMEENWTGSGIQEMTGGEYGKWKLGRYNTSTPNAVSYMFSKKSRIFQEMLFTLRKFKPIQISKSENDIT